MTLRELVVAIGFDVDPASLAKVEGVIGRVKGGLVALGGLAAAGGAALGMKRLADETAALGADVVSASARLGISTDAVQELRAAAELTDVPVETLDHAIQRLGHSAGQTLREPFGEAARSFARLGITVRDQQGHLRDGDELFMDLAEQISRMPNKFERLSAAQSVLGKTTGSELLPLLIKGKAGIAALRAKLDEHHARMSTKDLAAVQKYRLAAKEFEGQIHGLKIQVGLRLIEGFNAAREVLARFFAAMQGEWTPVLITLGAILAPLAAVAVATAIKMAAAWVIAAAPLLAAAAAAAALYLAIDDVYGYMIGKDSALGRAITRWQILADIFNGLRWMVDKAETGALQIAAYAQGESREQFANKISGGRYRTLLAQGYSPEEAWEKIGSPGILGAPPSVPTPAMAPGAGVTVAAPQMTAHISVSVPPGADAAGIGAGIRESIDQWWDDKMRETLAATPGYGVLKP